MNKVMKIVCLFVLSAVITGCSELLQRDDLADAVKGNLLVIDEKNQSLNLWNPADSSIKQVGVFPTTTANEIKIDGYYAYVVLSSPFSNPSDGNKLIRFGLTNSIVQVLNLPVDSNPYNEEIDDQKIYVTLSKSNMIAVIDKSTFSVERYISLASISALTGAPYGITVDDQRIFVATSAGYIGWGDPGNYANSRITVIAKSDYSIVNNIPVAKNPQSMTIVGGKMYLTAASDYDFTGKVQCLDLDTWSLTDMPGVTAGAPVFIKSYSNKIYYTDATWGGSGGLQILDLSSPAVTTVLSGVDLKGIAFDGINSYLSEGFGGNNVYELNIATMELRTITGIGGGDCTVYN